MPINWPNIREQFPALKNWTFLNTATFGQMPLCATEAVQRHFAHRDELACADFLDWFSDIDVVRGKIGKLINCSADDIAFIPNASTGLSIFLRGITWKKGDRIVTLQGEFPNHLYAPYQLEKYGVEFVQVPWEGFYDALTENTRAVLMSTCNYVTGFRPPVHDLAPLLRERGIAFYVDGTQTIGALRFDTGAIQPDVLSVHGYKWLLSPTGAGFVYLHPRFREQTAPVVVGWRSDRDWRQVNELNHGRPVYVTTAERYEGAMPDFPAIYAMGASTSLFLSIGPDEIERRVLHLACELRKRMESLGGRVLHPDSAIASVRFEGNEDPVTQTSRIAARLKEKRVLVSSRHGGLRVSVHLYNNEHDLDTLCDALKGEI